MYTNKPFRLKKGDRKPYYLTDLKQADGTPVPGLSTATTIEFRMSHRANEKKVTGTATLVDEALARVQYEWLDGDTDTEGEYLVSFRVIWPGNEPQSFPTDGYKSLFVEALVGE